MIAKKTTNVTFAVSHLLQEGTWTYTSKEFMAFKFGPNSIKKSAKKPKTIAFTQNAYLWIASTWLALEIYFAA